MNFKRYQTICLLGILIFAFFSCGRNRGLRDYSFEGVDDTLRLSISVDEIELKESEADESIEFDWSTGTNYGTNQSISYLLEIHKNDEESNKPIKYDLGKNEYKFILKKKNLNNILLNNFNIEPGERAELRIKIIAYFNEQDESTKQEDTSYFTAIPYKPVSDSLYLVGSASPNGWDADNAIKLEKTGNGTFNYKGKLKKGKFKFITTMGEFLPSYNRGVEEKDLFHRVNDNDPDDLFMIQNSGIYDIEINLIKEKISMSAGNEAPRFDNLWILGDGTESGWEIDDPIAFEQDEDDPYIFEYKGELTTGEMKIFAGPLGDFCGEWYRPVDDAQAITNSDADQNSGCEDDNTWEITEETEGEYKITVDTKVDSVSIKRI